MNKTNLLHPSCKPFKIGLESDYAQKNQITTQDEYYGMCGRFPSLREFPPNKVPPSNLRLPPEFSGYIRE
jgi:hypothetical protein